MVWVCWVLETDGTSHLIRKNSDLGGHALAKGIGIFTEKGLKQFLFYPLKKLSVLYGNVAVWVHANM